MKLNNLFFEIEKDLRSIMNLLVPNPNYTDPNSSDAVFRRKVKPNAHIPTRWILPGLCSITAYHPSYMGELIPKNTSYDGLCEWVLTNPNTFLNTLDDDTKLEFLKKEDRLIEEYRLKKKQEEVDRVEKEKQQAELLQKEYREWSYRHNIDVLERNIRESQLALDKRSLEIADKIEKIKKWEEGREAERQSQLEAEREAQKSCWCCRKRKSN